MKCCLKSASKLKPCLNDQSSAEEAFIDVYIQNQTSNGFYLVSSDVRTNSRRGFVDVSGNWIITPAQYIKGGETIFFRAYSGKISVTDADDCFFPTEFSVDFTYISPDQPGSLKGFLTKTRDGVGTCSEVNPFSPLEQRYEFEGKINVYQNVSYVPPEQGVERWRNTAFVILSGVTSCKTLL